MGAVPSGAREHQTAAAVSVVANRATIAERIRIRTGRLNQSAIRVVRVRIDNCSGIVRKLPCLSLRPEVMSEHVEQLPADLQRGQPVEVAQGRRPNRLQSSIEPDHGVLGHIARLFPAPQPRITPKHDVCQTQQPVAEAFQKGSPSGRVPLLETLQAML